RMDDWQRLHDRFMQLKEEEEGFMRNQIGRPHLRAHVDIVSDPPFCILRDGPNDNFTSRFELVATEAGIALVSPSDVRPRDYWLATLFKHFKPQNSDYIDRTNERGGILEDVCSASATFCAR